MQCEHSEIKEVFIDDEKYELIKGYSSIKSNYITSMRGDVSIKIVIANNIDFTIKDRYNIKIIDNKNNIYEYENILLKTVEIYNSSIHTDINYKCIQFTHIF